MTFSNKEEKRKKILDTFDEINRNHFRASWTILNQIALQVAGFVEKYRYQEDTKDKMKSYKGE